ncbi:hypothetical protein [Cohaesibacter sp. ES.047]|uniref:hypothetical protein n=1 Tax=Cohaesibacter sp. ES.047 TaxID=1798205 RepID=UPI000BB710CB|nr:hypothetical protein [Cohaesibacter sp. ES.047]
MTATGFSVSEASANSNYADIAKATCSGKLSGLKEIREGAYERKSPSAMLWLRWLYMNKKCESTYTGSKSKAKELLLMAADAGDAGAARTVGRNMIRGTGGFDANIKQGKEYLFDSADAGEINAAIDLAEEFASGEYLKQNFKTAQNLVDWAKRRDHSNNFRIRALEMKLSFQRSKANPNKNKPKVAKSKSAKTQSAKPQKAKAKAADQGTKGELVYSGMPLQLECWRYVDLKSAITDNLMKATRQNEQRTAKRDAVKEGNGLLKVHNFYYFDVVTQDMLDHSKHKKNVGVAEKISFYSSRKPPKCTATSTIYATRNDMLGTIKKHYVRVWPANELNWRLVSVPSGTLSKLANLGIVVR